MSKLILGEKCLSLKRKICIKQKKVNKRKKRSFYMQLTRFQKKTKTSSKLLRKLPNDFFIKMEEIMNLLKFLTHRNRSLLPLKIEEEQWK